MKKILVAILLIVPFLCCNAQKKAPTVAQIAHYKAVQMSRQMEMDDSLSMAFIPVYESFQLETGRLMEESRKGRSPEVATDEQAEIQILADFETSRKLLEIRERYYGEFKKILTPLQIRRIYSWEKINAQKSASSKK